MKSTVDEILQAAGAEHHARAPAEIVDFPVRSRFLDRTAPKPHPAGAIRVWTPVAWIIQSGPYMSVALISVMVLLGWSYMHKRSILADIGEFACSADGQALFLENDPDSTVPRLHEELLIQCARAARLL